jgi:hypothetical protein
VNPEAGIGEPFGPISGEKRAWTQWLIPHRS